MRLDDGLGWDKMDEDGIWHSAQLVLRGSEQ